MVGIMVLENLLYLAWNDVQTAWRSKDTSTHRAEDGSGLCTAEPLFVQCPCDKNSVTYELHPKAGYLLNIVPKNILGTHVTKWSEIYDSNGPVKLTLIYAHADYHSQFLLTREMIDTIRPDFSNRQYLESIDNKKLMEPYESAPFGRSDLRGKTVPRHNAQTFVILTTDGSYARWVHEKLGFTYKWSTRPVQPSSGEGSKTRSHFNKVLVNCSACEEVHPAIHALQGKRCLLGYGSALMLRETRSPGSVSYSPRNSTCTCITKESGTGSRIRGGCGPCFTRPPSR